MASHLNTANSCCHHVFLRHFRFQKCLPGNINNCSLYMIMISDILIQSDFLYVLYHNSRTRAIALYRPASHGCSFVNGARKEYVCFAAAFFSSALIISHFVCPFLFFINLHPDFLSSIPIACTQKFSPENITFPKTKSVIFPILKFFYFPSTQIDFFVG